jgi:hypothetical protein
VTADNTAGDLDTASGPFGISAPSLGDVEIPAGLCQCGCGGATSRWRYDDPKGEHFRGEFRRYLRYHHVSPGGLKSLSEHFWDNLKAGGSNECWLWRGPINAWGYGHLIHRGKCHKAHRLSYSLHNGHIPFGLVVRHTCDNPPCCNPDHLLIGTRAENTQDAVERDRLSRGEMHVGAVLSEDAVIEIRRLRTAGAKGVDLAHMFGVSEGTISDVVRYKTWRRPAERW